MAKKKYYVVWAGRKTGVFDSWEECYAQIFGFPKAVYKSFETKDLAHDAFTKSSKNFVGKSVPKSKTASESSLSLSRNYVRNSIAVDGAHSSSTGLIEYQGVHIETGQELFHGGPFEEGTNNIAEFLAIVHALAYCKEKNLKIPIYSDSRNAMGWVRDKKARTNLSKSPKNRYLFELIDRAIKWLNNNSYENKVLKWETRIWGENPADFGRK